MGCEHGHEAAYNDNGGHPKDHGHRPVIIAILFFAFIAFGNGEHAETNVCENDRF